MSKRIPRITLARAYNVGPKDSGYRVLVDRLWPRGVSKETLALDAWCRELAPSTELRRWFDHRQDRWEEFRQRYFRELDEKRDEVGKLLAIAEKRPLLLIYSARDEEYNNAMALREFLVSRRPRKPL